MATSGAAQGVLLLGLMGVLIPEEQLQRMNALKNLLVALVNLTAGIQTGMADQAVLVTGRRRRPAVSR
ncbi:hypothetical protein OHR68_33215 [Spirillospora sp. NBC_00431]